MVAAKHRTMCGRYIVLLVRRVGNGTPVATKRVSFISCCVITFTLSECVYLISINNRIAHMRDKPSYMS